MIQIGVPHGLRGLDPQIYPSASLIWIMMRAVSQLIMHIKPYHKHTSLWNPS